MQQYVVFFIDTHPVSERFVGYRVYVEKLTYF